ncbi:hypothetical protein IT072_09460 [Leifsonia sp. ZF2019]|uniref:DUF6412 domain-containing protein n=1 Tax=Leifsonia sp. ZF2019 TaxID=2781978 RepID=UPI001CBC66A7|nr:DUF6412 domain-containing protein [Leifsonia sp. ZF2019]UAJ81182.1 hypothetical protein IT072_09460 [Leifsonia sp. ZF2019]
MSAVLELLAHLVASALGVSWSVSGPAGIIAAAGVAGAIGLVAAVAATSLRSVAALAASLRGRTVWSRPAEPEVAARVESASHPDTDGRPRPRAPGSLLPAV